jgi:molybdopterin-guanine dinucleotide biosynthesis protein B
LGGIGTFKERIGFNGMKAFGLAGWSGSGKTTLLESLLRELIGRGLKVSTIKHAHHNLDVDRPGKDSYRHRAAGASEVVLLSSNRWTLMHELRGGPEPTPEELIERMAPVDLVLGEGFKKHTHDKLEVHRPSLGKPLLCQSDPYIVAVASDAPLDTPELPVFDLNNVQGIADFILSRCGVTSME